MRVSSLVSSWDKLRQAGTTRPAIIQPAANAAAETAAEQNNTFTQEDLEFQWLAMCNRMPQQYSSIATRMKNMVPTITDFPAVEVVVNNEIIKNELDNIRGSVLNTLKMHLRNSSITLSIQVAEMQGQMKVLTRREQFEQMSEENAAVEKLREVFSLELA